MPMSAARAAASAEAVERQRQMRQRLEASVSGLEELEHLRQQQEVLVRGALELREEEQEERRKEEKLLEENILLLRKQLNCLRRRDAGLISQLQELDRQICDLRLDSEASHDQLETDSRPSSGFYDLSDGASVSLSNSSNSVFSECFCSMNEADGRLLSADELASCLDCDGLVGGLCDESSSGLVRRSLSAPHPASLDPVSSVDSQSKYHCDLVARNGSDVYRYPSPLHAVAVQSPVFLQMLGHGGPGRDEGLLKSVEGLKPESSPLSASDAAPLIAPLVSQSSSWPASSSSSQTPSYKQLDSYIYSLLQRRALPVRTSRPRTSISADTSKSILRQASLCVRQFSGSGFGTLRGSEFKPSVPTGGVSAGGVATSSPQRQRSVDSRSEEQETQKVFPECSVDSMQNVFKINIDPSSNSLLKQKSKTLLPPSPASTATLPQDSPKETKQPCYSPDLLLKSPPAIKTATPNNSPNPPQTVQTEKVDRSVPEVAGRGSSSQSQDEGGGGGSHMVNTKCITAQRHTVKLRKGGSKNLKMVKVKTTTTMRTSRASEHNELSSERRGDKSHHRPSSKKSRLLDEKSFVNINVSKRAAGGVHGASTSRIKRLPASIPEGRVVDKRIASTVSSVQSGASRHHYHGNHHHHGRDQVVAKPKYKRNDYRRLRAIMEVPNDEAFRRTQRRQRKELLSPSAANVFLPPAEQVSSPYSYVAGSDSEYSAECASLFHSTIVDTSEDEWSNYTTNRFGDSESGEEEEEEFVEESTATSDTEESGGGGAGGGTGGMGRGQSQLGAAVQQMSPAQAKAFVKIKASHNLKKKILRFRSGSLKLMTTV
ncbi:dapper homolog 1 [Anarhichas minor]|uniref:dapper homolog 1 n=1 Tax=Anarhichas minor TaxID=65739 RepID=UPI003F737467